MKSRELAALVIPAILLLLWIPAVTDKVLNFQQFSDGMLLQPIPGILANILIYLVPTFEMATILLLTIPSFRKFGFLLSIAIMTIMTGYVGIVLLLAPSNLPCSCGSLIPNLGWFWHFWFNLFFLILSIAGYYNHRLLQRRSSSRLATFEGVSAKRRYTNKI